MLGNWYTQKFTEPYEHIIIHNFFENPENIQLECVPDSSWVYYDNPLEKKYTKKVSGDSTFSFLQSDEFLEKMKGLTGIHDLETDPHLHGAGYAMYPNGGKLDIHLDYSIHPISGKERRCNLIVYISKDWKKEYGGGLELWNKELTHYKTVEPTWNSAIIFKTTDESWHGIPNPIECPENEYRKSIAVYYVSEPQQCTKNRPKAEFIPHPFNDVEKRYEKLYEIRKTRNIIKDDFL